MYFISPNSGKAANLKYQMSCIGELHSVLASPSHVIFIVPRTVITLHF